MDFRTHLLASVSVIAISGAMVAPVLAGDAYSMPAVSAPNGKVGAYVGTLGDDFTLGATGSFAVPLAEQWGAQVDGLVGTAAGGAYYGVGGHLFWRDPSKGLLGAYGSWVTWDGNTVGSEPDNRGYYTLLQGATVGKIGLEGEAYFSRISLEGLVGYQFGSLSGATAKGVVAFYPTDDLRLDIGVNYLQGPGASLLAGIEWQPTGSSMSLFADATLRSNSASVVGGVRFALAPTQKSLIQRHRQDDPDNLLPADLFGIENAKYCPPGRVDDGSYCYND